MSRLYWFERTGAVSWGQTIVWVTPVRALTLLGALHCYAAAQLRSERALRIRGMVAVNKGGLGSDHPYEDGRAPAVQGGPRLN